MMLPVDIDREGDVVLVCGEDEKQEKLRVCSKTMSRASRVFRSMLLPRYREGTQLHSEGCIELQLLEDDATSMIVLCRIAHLQNHIVPTLMPITELLTISRLCDKYDMSQMLSTQALAWISAALENVSEDDSNQAAHRKACLVAAYYFGHVGAFAKVGYEMTTKDVDYQRDKSRETWPADTPESFVATSDALADERERVQHFLSDEIADVVNRVAARGEDEGAEEGIVCPPSCTFAERLLAFVISSLRSRKLWPPETLRGQSLQAVWRALEDDAWMRRRLDSEITVCDARRCVGNGFDDEDDTNSVENLAPLVEIARGKSQAMIKLLCYECVRNGKTMDADCKHRKA